MSVQSEIDRIKKNVNDTLKTIGDAGVTVGAGSDSLPAAALALANEKQDKLENAASLVYHSEQQPATTIPLDGNFPVSQIDGDSVTLQPNTSTVILGQPTALNISLAPPVQDKDSEWRIIFKAGNGFQLTDTAPDGYTLKWDAEPVWQAGTVYEVSYGNEFLTGADGMVIIGVLWRAWT